ncbi:MAG: hypothetical protein HY904_12610 [Deltaproteobacteria bacterium]|nr:hypothetical protein [Deltaproteobacteria bacterium]
MEAANAPIVTARVRVDGAAGNALLRSQSTGTAPLDGQTTVAWWRRVGDVAEVEWQSVFSATPSGSGALKFVLPSGAGPMDMTPAPIDLVGLAFLFGTGSPYRVLPCSAGPGGRHLGCPAL